MDYECLFDGFSPTCFSFVDLLAWQMDLMKRDCKTSLKFHTLSGNKIQKFSVNSFAEIKRSKPGGIFKIAKANTKATLKT